MVFNPLPEFVEENGGFTPVDLDIEDDLSDDPQWLRKIQYRVGAVVIEFNALERVVDESILDIMNERAEDSRVWVFLETMPAAKKIKALFQIYERMFEHCEVAESTRDKARDLNRQVLAANTTRNFYVHANWVNTIQEMVEHRPRRTTSGTYGRIRRKVSIADVDADIAEMQRLGEELEEFHDETVQEMFARQS